MKRATVKRLSAAAQCAAAVAALCSLGCDKVEPTASAKGKPDVSGSPAITRAPIEPRDFSPPSTDAAVVGKKLFFDERLSASGSMSCATCHDPDHAYGPPNDLAVQLGGPERHDPGMRAVPSLRYKEFTPAYADLLDNPDGISAPGPGGGFAWDGRANTLTEQAKAPLLSKFEMANGSSKDVAARVRAAAYAPLFRQAFGENALDDTDRAFANVLAALEAFQREDRSFHPYTSKFDLHAGNKVGGEWTPAEARGSRVFNDPAQGNCASCHYPGTGLGGSSGIFTDYSYEAIGVPRNAALAANEDPSYYDLGVCGPLREDHLPGAPAHLRFCGMFKTPTLRNVTTRHVFFHNGVMGSIEQVLRFYATRDSMPELWYPTRGGTAKATNDPRFPAYGLVKTQYTGGTVQKYDDLPRQYRANVDPQLPLDGRKPGSRPALDEQQMKDLLCYLETLTDGYVVPATPKTSGPCVD